MSTNSTFKIKFDTRPQDLLKNTHSVSSSIMSFSVSQHNFLGISSNNPMTTTYTGQSTLPSVFASSPIVPSQVPAGFIPSNTFTATEFTLLTTLVQGSSVSSLANTITKTLPVSLLASPTTLDGVSGVGIFTPLTITSLPLLTSSTWAADQTFVPTLSDADPMSSFSPTISELSTLSLTAPTSLISSLSAESPPSTSLTLARVGGGIIGGVVFCALFFLFLKLFIVSKRPSRSIIDDNVELDDTFNQNKESLEFYKQSTNPVQRIKFLSKNPFGSQSSSHLSTQIPCATPSRSTQLPIDSYDLKLSQDKEPDYAPPSKLWTVPHSDGMAQQSLGSKSENAGQSLNIPYFSNSAPFAVPEAIYTRNDHSYLGTRPQQNSYDNPSGYYNPIVTTQPPPFFNSEALPNSVNTPAFSNNSQVSNMPYQGFNAPTVNYKNDNKPMFDVAPTEKQLVSANIPVNSHINEHMDEANQPSQWGVSRVDTDFSNTAGHGDDANAFNNINWVMVRHASIFSNSGSEFNSKAVSNVYDTTNNAFAMYPNPMPNVKPNEDNAKLPRAKKSANNPISSTLSQVIELYDANGLAKNGQRSSVLHMKAISHYAAVMEDELAMEKGDLVNIYQIFPDGWGYGENLESGARGMCPMNFLSPPPNPTSHVVDST
ncbi:hypothetical protein QVD99_008363 [Batrachochytrium dendrobatidis]|nr:hypothetical protein QVD99_008363 [Batrachochytrium dendrobatidis]